MLVEMWMTRDPITILPTASISEAALVMARHHIRRLVVVDRQPDGRIAGIVSAGNVARAFPPDLNPASALVTERSVPAPVSTIMTRVVQTVAADAGVDDAARQLRRHKIGALPVLRGGRLVGIITESDVFRAIVEIFEANPGGSRVTFEVDEGEDLLPAIAALCARHPLRIVSLFSFRHRDARDGRERRLGVARLAGEASEPLLDALWRSHHRVVSVTHCGSERT